MAQTALPGKKMPIRLYFVEAFSSRLARALALAPTVALPDETTAASSERFGRLLLAAVVGMLAAESEIAGTAPAAAGLPQQSLKRCCGLRKLRAADKIIVSLDTVHCQPGGEARLGSV